MSPSAVLDVTSWLYAKNRTSGQNAARPFCPPCHPHQLSHRSSPRSPLFRRLLQRQRCPRSRQHRSFLSRPSSAPPLRRRLPNDRWMVRTPRPLTIPQGHDWSSGCRVRAAFSPREFMRKPHLFEGWRDTRPARCLAPRKAPRGARPATVAAWQWPPRRRARRRRHRAACLR